MHLSMRSLNRYDTIDKPTTHLNCPELNEAHKDD